MRRPMARTGLRAKWGLRQRLRLPEPSPMPEPTRRRALASLLAFSSLSPCALAQGAATAVVTDSAEGGGRSGGLFFFLAAANGVEIAETALSSSRKASYMRGDN